MLSKVDHRLLLFFALTFILQACANETLVTPKPRAYPKVEYPLKKYQLLEQHDCGFQFEYPTYARYLKDSTFFSFEKDAASSCWFDIGFLSFNGRLHCTYYEIDKSKTFDDLKKETFQMADYHNVRANYIDELKITRPNARLNGILFAIEGPSASPLQFYVTDEEKHFFRGSLYFNTAVRPDSIAPIYEFVRADVMKMIESFEWTE